MTTERSKRYPPSHGIEPCTSCLPGRRINHFTRKGISLRLTIVWEQYDRNIGHIIAKAIFDNKYMDCYFTRSFYKHILGVSVRYMDMESVDSQFYKSLVMLLENDIHEWDLGLTFSLDAFEFGENKVIELIPNGSTTIVTNDE
ncbi:unnamed protein product [Rotaria socialis]|uniref:HECT-type E3 ubiquitin transferase n=1 Tax=Rotaria socialis TaxID=392032 RepID=A0A818PBA4_9BILA|nr:unnamed protein product [Rotaria socialis]